MDPAAIRRHIESTFPGVDVTEDEGSLFFTHAPQGDRAAQRFMPFATLVVSDKYDPASDLASRGAFRLNIGIPMPEYRRRFGEPPPFPKDGGVAEPSRDYTVLDTLMPHPIYASMGWVSVLNPGRSWPEASRLLAQAHEHAAGKG